MYELFNLSKDCFVILLLITFFLLPFNYFYAEEKASDYEIDIDIE